jgi:hypothetical protein
MPDLSEGLAIIIGTIIGAFITALGSIINRRLNKRQREEDSRERFFYEVYPKRLAVYEEVIKELETMKKSGESLISPRLTRDAARGKVYKDIYSLNALYARIRMYGSAKTLLFFTHLIFTAEKIPARLREADAFPGGVFGQWIGAVNETLEDIIQNTRGDAGSNLVDEFITKHYEIKEGFFSRIKGTLFPSKMTKSIKKSDRIYKQIQDAMRREKNARIDDGC